jgi:hypothetical protein
MVFWKNNLTRLKPLFIIKQKKLFLLFMILIIRNIRLISFGRRLKNE